MWEKIGYPKEISSDLKILIFLILAVIILNYSFVDSITKDFFDIREKAHVNRIIDGDTIESGNASIRLIGINTPEKGEFFYHDAKSFLEAEILNKTVSLEFTKRKKDKYGRILAYVFLGDKNINIELVRNGFANPYFYSGTDKYSQELLNAWRECIRKEINLCEPSTDLCRLCIQIDNSKNFIINNCSFDCNIKNWKIKGEGREKFIFNLTLRFREKAEFKLDLTNSGGNLFIWDEQGKFVLWKEK